MTHYVNYAKWTMKHPTTSSFTGILQEQSDWEMELTIAPSLRISSQFQDGYKSFPRGILIQINFLMHSL